MAIQNVNKFVVCYDAVARQGFLIDEIHLADRKYRANLYRVDLRLSFHKNDIILLKSDEFRSLCFDRVTNKMTGDKLWRRVDSLYVVTYRVRLLKETIADFLNKQKALEAHDEVLSDDSAYFTSLDESSRDVSLDNESLLRVRQFGHRLPEITAE